LLLLVACGADAPAPLDAEIGDFQVRIERSPARLTVAGPDGAVLLDGAAFDVGWGDATFEHQFGAFRILEGPHLVEPVTAFDDVRVDGGVARFGLRVGRRRAATAEIAPAGEGGLAIRVEASRGADDRARVRFGCAAGEHFLGLGGQSFDVDHRGQRVPLWVAEDGLGKLATDDYIGAWQLIGRRHSTHTPIPIVLSSRRYALLLDTSHHAVFDLCATAPEEVAVEAWEPALRLVLFAGATPSEAIARVTAHVGRPALPPAFAFAPWLDAIFGSDNVRRVAAKLRAEGVASSVIWTEDWRGGNFEGDTYALEEDWELDRDLYPDFEALAGELHAQGFKLLVYHNSFLMSSTGTYAEAVAGGHTIRDAAGAPYLFDAITFEPTTLLDLTSPAARAWAKGKLAEGLRLGADGWMADFAEWLPTDAVLASGVHGEAHHNLYPVEWARLNAEALADQQAVDGVERLFFVRAAWLGSQPLVSVVWAGDQQTDFQEGDGLPSVIPMGIGLGVTGFPYYGHDIAGYMHLLTTPTTRELWYRWVTLGALSPVMRTHHGRAPVASWHWERDAASTAHLARWARLHMQLFPYLYAMAKLAADTGMPMFRPLALAYPDFAPGWTSRDQFMLGDRIVVAPVVTMGAVERVVELPPGRWFPLLGGPGRDGGVFTAAAPLEEIPAFVPAGAMLALLPPGVDTVVAATSGATTLADAGDDRELWLWPGGSSRMTEVSGLSYDWDAGTLDGAPSTATWNGAPVDPADLVVAGSGVLALDGGATLRVDGGRPDRRLTVRFPASTSTPRRPVSP
jgi:alpha-glucosidase (family GH31 glycosyl hydrolase)